jgi:hypothetical protein
MSIGGRVTIKRSFLACALVCLGLGAAAQAQQWGGRGWRANPLREGLPERRGGFTFCRLLYDRVRSEAGGYGWNTDYPAADANLMYRLAELTLTHVSRWEDGQLGHAVVRATDRALFECPFLYAVDVGTVGFAPDEVLALRTHLQKGGFLWVDDFWGNRAWEQWVQEIHRVLPDYPIVDLPLDHPLWASAYHVPKVPQIPSISHWRRSGGGTSERGAESAEPHMRAIFDDRNRLVVLMSHNTDIADGWEREGEDDRFFALFSPDAYAVAINVVLWALTH